MIYQDNWIVQPNIYKKSITKNDGSIIKIESQYEKFFVEVAYIKKNGDIVGRINNHLLVEKPYKIGDLVIFQRKHIIELRTNEERHEIVDKIIPELTDMIKIYMIDFKEKNGRYPTKTETEIYFERNFNTV